MATLGLTLSTSWSWSYGDMDFWNDQNGREQYFHQIGYKFVKNEIIFFINGKNVKKKKQKRILQLS